MRIGIDARFWGPSHTGLGVYTRELIEALSQIDSTNEYVLIIRKEAEDLIKLPKNFTTVICEVQAYSLEEQLRLPFLLYELKLDIVHFPSINVPIFYFGKYVVTVHDLIKHISRGSETTTRHPFLYWIKYIVYRLLFLIVIHRAQKIFVPSHTVASELSAKYPLTKKKIKVTLEAPVLKKEKKLHLDLPEKFAIYTGNAYPHKNLIRLILAWKNVFEETGTTLILSSGRSVFTKRIERIITENKADKYVKFYGYLSDEQLSTAYQHAEVYMFPSLIEGFGLPGLDAMQCGLPVVCSDIPVLREIYGDAAHYFDPRSTEDISKKVIEVINDKKLREGLIKKGSVQVKKYSWEKAAGETLDGYRNAYSL